MKRLRRLLIGFLLVASVAIWACEDKVPQPGGESGNGNTEASGGTTPGGDSGGGQDSGGSSGPVEDQGFAKDPLSKLGHAEVDASGDNGSQWKWFMDGVLQSNYGQYAGAVGVNYPVTLEINLSGFLTDEKGQEAESPIKRMMLLVYDGSDWIVLHDMGTPKFAVTWDDPEETRPLFGRYTIPHNMGQNQLKVIPYFENEAGKTNVDLEKLRNGESDSNYDKATLLLIDVIHNTNPM